MSSLPVGLEDVSRYPYLFAELIKRGWGDADLEKLAGRNMIRVFKQVEAVRTIYKYYCTLYRLFELHAFKADHDLLQVRDDMLASGVQPVDDLIPEEDLESGNECRTSS